MIEGMKKQLIRRPERGRFHSLVSFEFVVITIVLLLLQEGAGEEREADDCVEGGRRKGVEMGRRSSREEGIRRGH